MLLKKLSCFRQFRTVWIGGFPHRQEFLISHSCHLVVTQGLRCARQAKDGFWTVWCAPQGFLKVRYCLGGLIEFQQEMSTKFRCGSAAMLVGVCLSGCFSQALWLA